MDNNPENLHDNWLKRLKNTTFGAVIMVIVSVITALVFLSDNVKKIVENSKAISEAISPPKPDTLKNDIQKRDTLIDTNGRNKSIAKTTKTTKAAPKPKAKTDSHPVISQPSTPKISKNTEIEYIEASGTVIIDSDKEHSQAVLLAERGARVTAQTNLLENIKGIYIKQKTTVENMANTTSSLSAEVEGLIKGAEQIGETKINDNTVTIRLRIPKKDLPNN